MHSTRRELLDEFVAFVSESNDSTARTIAEGCLQRAMLAIWMRHHWRVYRSPVPLQLTLTVNQARYALPDYFGRVGPGTVRNSTRAGSTIPRLRDGELEQMYPDAGTTSEVAGIPERYEIAGSCGVHTQPLVTGETLEALSSSASDTDIAVAINGDDANGNWTRNQVTLLGTTPVSLGTWSYVDEVGKSYLADSTPVTTDTSSRGTVTIRKTSDQTEIQRLFTQESAKQHDIFTLYPKPSAADVLYLPVMRKPKRVFKDADPLPDLWGPALFEEMLLDWQVNTGDLNPIQAMQAPRPKYLDLLALEHQQQARPRIRPYSRV